MSKIRHLKGLIERYFTYRDQYNILEQNHLRHEIESLIQEHIDAYPDVVTLTDLEDSVKRVRYLDYLSLSESQRS